MVSCERNGNVGRVLSVDEKKQILRNWMVCLYCKTSLLKTYISLHFIIIYVSATWRWRYFSGFETQLTNARTQHRSLLLSFKEMVEITVEQWLGLMDPALYYHFVHISKWLQQRTELSLESIGRCSVVHQSQWNYVSSSDAPIFNGHSDSNIGWDCETVSEKSPNTPARLKVSSP